MNYKPLITELLDKFIKQYPEYTVAEILYSIYKYGPSDKVINGRADLKKLTDKEIYTALDKAISMEMQEEPIETEQ